MVDRYLKIFDKYKKIFNEMLNNTDYLKELKELYDTFNQSSFKNHKRDDLSLPEPITFFSDLSKLYYNASPNDKKKIQDFIDKYKPSIMQNYQDKNVRERQRILDASKIYLLDPVPSIAECVPDYSVLNISVPQPQLIQNLQSKIAETQKEIEKLKAEMRQVNSVDYCIQEELYNLIVIESSLFQHGSKHYPRCKEPITRQNFVNFFYDEMKQSKTNDIILQEFKQKFNFRDDDV